MRQQKQDAFGASCFLDGEGIKIYNIHIKGEEVAP